MARSETATAALENILQADADGQRQTVTDIAPGKSDTDRHAFRKVMQANGDDEQPDAAYPSRVRPLPPELEMLMGKTLVNQVESDRPHQQPRNDHQRC